MCNQASIFFFNLKDAYQVEVLRFCGVVCGVWLGQETCVALGKGFLKN
jgi:hypothetical protein